MAGSTRLLELLPVSSDPRMSAAHGVVADQTGHRTSASTNQATVEEPEVATRVEAHTQEPRFEAVDPGTNSERAAERSLERAILRSIVVSVVVMIALWALLVAVVLQYAGGSLR
jgi:hypothetical protein